MSDYKAAEAIAARFGNAPYEERYRNQNCAGGNFERCAYTIAMNDSSVQTLLLKHPSLRHLGLREWWGYAVIYIENRTVIQYWFWVWYETSNGNWRGFGAREGKALPKYEPVQALISGSYSIERHKVNFRDPLNDLGFMLQSSLTPVATQSERQRAWNFQFGCLAQQQTCGEICEVMPDAWRDFYDKRGHFDVEKSGSAYMFCSKPGN